MNEYKITYATEDLSFEEARITERTEGAARKAFNSRFKGQRFSIQNIELIRDDALATKDEPFPKKRTGKIEKKQRKIM